MGEDSATGSFHIFHNLHPKEGSVQEQDDILGKEISNQLVDVKLQFFLPLPIQNDNLSKFGDHPQSFWG